MNSRLNSMMILGNISINTIDRKLKSIIFMIKINFLSLNCSIIDIARRFNSCAPAVSSECVGCREGTVCLEANVDAGMFSGKKMLRP